MLPKMFTWPNVNVGVCIIGDDLFETELYFITFDEDEKEKKQFKIVNDVLFLSL